MKKFAHSSYEDFCKKFNLDLNDDFNVGFDLLERIANEDPERLCIRHVDARGKTRDINFREFNDSASRVANALKNLGLGKGDRVLLALFRRLEWWEAMLGLHKLGAVAIPAPSQLTAHDLEYRINKAGVKCVIVDAELAARVDEAEPLCPCLQHKIVAGEETGVGSWARPGSTPTDTVPDRALEAVEELARLENGDWQTEASETESLVEGFICLDDAVDMEIFSGLERAESADYEPGRDQIACPDEAANLETFAWPEDYRGRKGLTCLDDGVSTPDFAAAAAESLNWPGADAQEAISPDNAWRLDGVTRWLRYELLVSLSSPYFPKPSNPEELACGTDPLLIFFSSGTTGMPKMVLHDHNYAMAHAFTGLYWHDLEPGDVHLTVADTGWGKAIWGKSYGQWLAGAAVFVYDYRGRFEPKKLLEVMCLGGVTGFCAPPTIYRFLIREDLSAYDLSGLKKCTTAGELLNESVFHEWKRLTGLEIREGYGQTETALLVATLPCMAPKAGSIGRPVPGWEVELLNDEGEICGPGEEGEICVRVSERLPVGLFKEYFEDPERTAQAVYDGWYHTGDKASMDEDGYFWFLGRVDDLIKSSGYRIGPFEVESALVAHPAVVEAAITGVPDPVRGQIVKATVVLAQGFEPCDFLIRELQEHVKAYTAPYKYPRVVEFVEELPKTISGKIRRAEIRASDTRGTADVA